MKRIVRIAFFTSLLFLSSKGFSQNLDINYLSNAIKEVENNNYTKALEYINQAIIHNPKDAIAVDFKGRIELELGKEKEACQTFADGVYLKNINSAQQYVEKCLQYDPKLDLKDFKTGVYSLKLLYTKKEIEIFLTREGNVQTEFFEGKNYKGEIKWINRGAYTLSPIAENKKVTKNTDEIRAIKMIDNQYLYIKIGKKKEETQFGIIKKMGK